MAQEMRSKNEPQQKKKRVRVTKQNKVKVEPLSYAEAARIHKKLRW